MLTSELDYELPAERIAQHPVEQRDQSRLMVLDRQPRTIRTGVFRELATHLRAGDCLVLNDTRVIRARLRGFKLATRGKVELLLLREMAPGEWDVLVRPSRQVRPGTAVQLSGGVRATIEDILPGGHRRVVFEKPNVLELLEEAGEVPLPPYIHRDRPDDADRTRYQTIYARVPGAVAAPTAGLHFTEEVFASLTQAGIATSYLTLHVGYGTFRPIKTDRLEDHVVESEEFDLPEGTAERLNQTRAGGGRVVAVGTTAARVLETRFRNHSYQPGRGSTDRYMYPPYAFHAVDALVTNFHLPRSSLLALVCAFAGRGFILEAYRMAIRERYRFYSYGDAMLIL
ncbi:MAG: tRNA preQ1(34) S-adenosylmethionine ribosyltransferase-isomerase QueA [Candidatus Hydrogenedentes bacterium]|nr:tRNA preQ1(34) S-adenosylmethionine ribosyltransferase-isomerase QueA [Candidatus Hydrogenedentota bacterium]